LLRGSWIHRGKTAREIYRFSKGLDAAISISREMSKDFLHSMVIDQELDLSLG